MFWDFKGVVVSPSPSSEIASFGDGDLVKAFSGGQLQFTKIIQESTLFAAPVSFNLLNNSGTQFVANTIVSNVKIIAESAIGSSGQLWNAGVYMTAGSAIEAIPGTMAAAGAINLTSYVYKPKNSTQSTWQYYGHTDDMTGLPGGLGNGNVTGSEQDISCNGTEAVSTVYDPTTGSRNIMLARAHGYTNAWQSGTNYDVGNIVTQTNTVAESIYYCTSLSITGTVGTSGTVEPAWPTGTTTVLDGNIYWILDTMASIPCQVSRGLQIAADTASAAMGAGLLVKGSIYSAAIDLSQVIPITVTGGGFTVASEVASIRLAPDMGIDFSAQGTLSTPKVNQNVLVYDSSSKSLEYMFSGTSLLSIGNNGTVTVTGEIVANSAAINSNLIVSDGISAGSIATTGNLAVGGELFVTGEIIAESSMAVAGTLSVGGELIVTGKITATSSATVNGDLQFGARLIDASTTVATPTSGSTVAISNSCSTCIIAGVSTISTLTITLPALPVLNQIVKIAPQVSVTTLVLNAGSHSVVAPPASLVAGAWVQKQYNSGLWI